LTTGGLLLSLIAAGCGGSDQPEIATVNGRVTLDGKPLPRGTVYFMPDNSKGTQGPMSMGEIGEDGRYKITSAGEREGAVIGFHQVRIEARRKPKDFRDTEPPSLIPQRYDNPATSELTAEVKAGIDNVIDLKLESTP
jgi:hypothetical protein